MIYIRQSKCWYPKQKELDSIFKLNLGEGYIQGFEINSIKNNDTYYE